MAWITPKINWTEDDYFNASDYNRIKDNADFLYGMGKVSSLTTDYPHSLVVTNLERTGTGALNIAESETDENYSIVSHSLLKKGRGYFSVEVLLNNDTTIFREFDSKKEGLLRIEEMRFPNATSWTLRRIQTQCFARYFDAKDTGAEKLVNDLLYARELNTVLDNLELIGSRVGLEFEDRPYYSADGSMPDADELNLIEQYEMLLYNRINSVYRVYLGVGGRVGTRFSNTII
jgi:hypothetical protein